MVMTLERADALRPSTSSGAGTRSERFHASPSVPVILPANRITGGPRALDHCRFWKLRGDAAARGHKRRARSRRAERVMTSQARRGQQASVTSPSRVSVAIVRM